MFNKKHISTILNEYIRKFPPDAQHQLDVVVDDEVVSITLEGSIQSLRFINVIINVLFKHISTSESDKFFVFDLCLAIEEALLNVFNHSYEGDSGKVEMEIFLEDNIISVKITDFGAKGVGLDLHKRLSAPPVDKFAVRGRGLLLINKAVDAIEYHSDGYKNTMTLIKKRGE